MLLSQTGIYALQAVLRLAQSGEDQLVAAAELARELDIPSGYLAKTLHRLRREGLLSSTRGAGGGYRLALPAREISVLRVVAPFQDVAVGKRCLLGGACDPEHPCEAHARWSRLTACGTTVLENTTVADLLGGTGDSPITRNDL
ncbi:MAG: Rrf2 family transcriptional regulator [Gemmatimonadota bacterium]